MIALQDKRIEVVPQVLEVDLGGCGCGSTAAGPLVWILLAVGWQLRRRREVRR